MNKIKAFFQGIYHQIITMHDSPHHIALGFAWGVFLGILPFTGVVAAVTVAAIFKFNKAAALMGSLLTNAWLSIVTFVLAGKLGCMILGLDWEKIYQQAKDVIFHFSWSALFKTASFQILLPLFLGYAIVGALCGFVSYWVILFILKKNNPR